MSARKAAVGVTAAATLGGATHVVSLADDVVRVGARAVVVEGAAVGPAAQVPRFARMGEDLARAPRFAPATPPRAFVPLTAADDAALAPLAADEATFLPRPARLGARAPSEPKSALCEHGLDAVDLASDGLGGVIDDGECASCNEEPVSVPKTTPRPTPARAAAPR